MPSRTEQLFRCRDLLDTPYANKPSFHSLLRGEISEEQDIANSLNNTGRPWTVAETQLNYYPGQTSFDVQVNGKVLFVVRLTGNPYIPALPVPYSDLNNQQWGSLWGMFTNYYQGAAYTLPETIEQMAFYRTGTINQQVKVQIQPAPQTACTYVITYLEGYIGNDDPLESAIALPEFATMVQLRNAVAQLPYCQWSEDRKQDAERKKELASAFAYQLERKERLFAEYRSSLVHPRTVSIEDWNFAS